MIEPSFTQDAKELTQYAFELSEELQEPVILRTTTRVSHCSGLVTLGKMEKRKTQVSFKKEPSKWVTLPAFSGGMHRKLLDNLEKAKTISNQSEYNPVYGDGKWGIITNGISFNYVMGALKDLGITADCRVLKLGLSYPLPEERIKDFISSCEKILVVEELEPFIEEAAKVIAQEMGSAISINGKGNGLFSRLSEFDPRLVRNVMTSYFGIEQPQKASLDLSDMPVLPPRPPNLCAGCPHRATYVTVRKVVGDDAIYASDIGCYALGFFPPLRMADLTISMGSGIATGSTLARTTGKKVISFIGDSTFFHSGIAPLCNAVFNNHNLTVIILDNGITAMTGLQPSPGGDSAKLGISNTQLPIEGVVKSIGVSHVSTVNPRNLKAMTKALEEAVAYNGVSVIISRDLCVLFAKQIHPGKKSTPFYVDPEKCKNHRDCIKVVACPALFVVEDQVRINEAACTGCTVCAQVCPENAIVPKKRKEDAR